MILEVNNTFDERRMYFLKDSSADALEDWDTLSEVYPPTFRNAWPKDFHVSPFNSRKGTYALSAQDLFFPHLSGTGKIDNTITLNSSKAHAKLVARIFSTQPSIDPTTLGYWARLRFIASWWWVGFVTFPRIVREAGKLFFRRKLHVWYRPEVLKDSIGRQATQDEMYVSFPTLQETVVLTATSIIERTFRRFLRYPVQSPILECVIKYISPIPSSLTEELFTRDSSTSTFPPREDAIEIRVLTPLFYARLARYAHISEFLSNEILTDDDKNRTFSVSHPAAYLRLFEQSETSSQNTCPNPRMRMSSMLDSISWAFLRWLRNHVRPSVQQPQQPIQEVDIRHFGFSLLDQYSMHHDPPEQAARYRSVVTKLLLSDIVAFGHPEMLDAVAYVFKILCSYLVAAGVKVFWGWVLSKRVTEVRMCRQTENEAWCEIETFYG